MAEFFKSSVFHNFKWLEVSRYHLCQFFIYLPLSQWGQDRSYKVLTETHLLCFCGSSSRCLVRQRCGPNGIRGCCSCGLSDSSTSSTISNVEAEEALSETSMSILSESFGSLLTSVTFTFGCWVFKCRWKLFVDPDLKEIVFCQMLHFAILSSTRQKCIQMLLCFLWLLTPTSRYYSLAPPN